MFRLFLRLSRAPFWFGLGLLLGFGVPYGIYLDRVLTSHFEALAYALPSRVYARPLQLRRGLALSAETLLIELAAARYRDDGLGRQPGTFHREGATFVIAGRAFRGPQGNEPERRVAVVLEGGRVSALRAADSAASIDQMRLDPARIATFYGSAQIERRPVRLDEVPSLLVSGLQAVEDRAFKHHFGIDPLAIVRAAYANLVAGEVVQGGSTLTQQLVRNLFLDRGKNLVRKLNEAALALLIEARFDKARILEAYFNEVYLGQQGGQAVHGVAAAAEFYFGRELKRLSSAEIALLIGMIQGPSYYDPRRHPERALARRNRVLGQMHETGLLSDSQVAVARAAPLGVGAAAGLPRNRYPAFLDLVEVQLKRDFPNAKLGSEGYSIYTTLAPSTQQLAEQALQARLPEFRQRWPGLEAALVVTRIEDGAIEGVLGGADAESAGFNRALYAARPIGSLIKPFVFLLALAEPERFSLLSPVLDAPIRLDQARGDAWMPANADGRAHGEIALIDALTHSYNLATVRLGLSLGVAEVRDLAAALSGAEALPAHPSLLLGALELTPLQTAQLYQYLATDGRTQQTYAVQSVLDAEGKAIARHTRRDQSAQHTVAARLVNFALQEALVSGTGHAVSDAGLGALHAAGKTGTSDDQRDSWFAGYTGDHLAVVWLGQDDNRRTGLMGATGALRVWMDLFRQLPTAPRKFAEDADIELVWIDPDKRKRTDAACPEARVLAFARGYAPQGLERCNWQKIKNWFRPKGT